MEEAVDEYERGPEFSAAVSEADRYEHSAGLHAVRELSRHQGRHRLLHSEVPDHELSLCSAQSREKDHQKPPRVRDRLSMLIRPAIRGAICQF